MEQAEIDPVRYGVLWQKVQHLEKQNEDLRNDIKNLTDKVEVLVALANQSKGGLWAGMAFASMGGAVLSWFVSHWGK